MNTPGLCTGAYLGARMARERLGAGRMAAGAEVAGQHGEDETSNPVPRADAPGYIHRHQIEDWGLQLAGPTPDRRARRDPSEFQGSDGPRVSALDLLAAVRDYSRAPGSERLLLFVLASYITDDSATCACSMPDLARVMGVSDRQITNLVNAMCASGELGIVRGRGRGVLTRYTLACVEKMRAEKVKPTSPFREKKVKSTGGFSSEKVKYTGGFSENKKVKPTSPFRAADPEKVKPSSPITPDQTDIQPEKVKPTSPLVHSSIENTKTAQAAAVSTSVFSPAILARALTEYEENLVLTYNRLFELEGFARAWAQWLEWKGAPYNRTPVILEAALEMLGKQPDPLEVLTYALTNGRDTLTARPAKGSARPGRRAQTVAEANATALENAVATYRGLEDDDTTLF